VVAQTGAEVAIVIFVEVLGVLFFALLISSISELLAQANRNARRLQVFRAKMQSVERWMLTQALPLRLQRRIKHFYADVSTLPHPSLQGSTCPGRGKHIGIQQCVEGGILAPPSVHNFGAPFHPRIDIPWAPATGVDPAARGEGGHCALPGAAARAAKRGGLAGLQSQLQVGVAPASGWPWRHVAACPVCLSAGRVTAVPPPLLLCLQCLAGACRYCASWMRRRCTC
jgi:hypothetical protein